MNVRFAYLGHSQIIETTLDSRTLSLQPNLAREAVAFDAPLLQPLRFREAMSALHDVVISDLRYKKRDKTAYLQWKQQEQQRVAALRGTARRDAEAEILSRQTKPVASDFAKTFEKTRRKYWDARIAYSQYLMRHDQDLWRLLMPCDPVITVADDVCLFECFSGDESSYGCLSVNRGDGFGSSDSVRLGTTNVDYSWDLYNHFQSMRSYRPTRFRLDPAGFDVAIASRPDYREEKIDLPAGWLQGFMQIQSAMTLPTTRISLPREAVYSIMAWHKRHRARTSPRAIRFELINGKPISVVIEPWEQRIECHGTRYDGPPIEPIRVWGARRLLSVARLLPLAERFDVHLLGTGLPSFWIAQMGEMRLTLGLSGWTTNDWTRSSALDLVMPQLIPSADAIDSVAAMMREKRTATLDDVRRHAGVDADMARNILRHLANSGQIIYDLSASGGAVYRWRQVMAQALGEAEMGPEHPELIGMRQIIHNRKIQVQARDEVSPGLTLVTGTVENINIEILIDRDGRIRRGKCLCGHYRRYGLKNGPCRHMLALRAIASNWRTPSI